MKRTIVALVLASVLGMATSGLAATATPDGEATALFDADQFVEAALSGALDDLLIENHATSCSPAELVYILLVGGCCGEPGHRVCA